jgi:hypothetical protein
MGFPLILYLRHDNINRDVAVAFSIDRGYVGLYQFNVVGRPARKS